VVLSPTPNSSEQTNFQCLQKVKVQEKKSNKLAKKRKLGVNWSIDINQMQTHWVYSSIGIAKPKTTLDTYYTTLKQNHKWTSKTSLFQSIMHSYVDITTIVVTKHVITWHKKPPIGTPYPNQNELTCNNARIQAQNIKITTQTPCTMYHEKLHKHIKTWKA
jgi:hypothetical protein